MATTSAFALSETTFQWQINGLSNPFTSAYYIQAGIFNTPFSDGSASPSGLISSVSSGSGDFFTPATVVGGATSAGNTYTMYGGMQAANGSWYGAGSDTFTSPTGGGDPGGPVRPSNFDWFNPKFTGATFEVYAFEWDDFCAKIDEFRNYKGLGNYSWFHNSSTFSGDIFFAARFNETIYAMDTMPQYFFASYVTSDTDIHAYDLNNVRDTLNSIP